jgi:hypothetical protein
MPDGHAQRIAAAAVTRRVAEPLRSLTRRLIGTPALVVALRPLAAFSSLPSEQIAADGIAPGADGEFVAFAAMSAPRPGPVHEWITRAAAAAFAADLDLPIVDAFTRRVLNADDALATLPGAARLTDVDGGFRLADWVIVQQAEQCLTTKGLGRFGLPELKADEVPFELHPAWTIALTGLSHRLLKLLRCELRRDSQAPFVRVPAQIDISRTDVGAAYGLELVQGGETLPVMLNLDPAITDAQDSYLSVDAPDNQPTAAHRLSVQATLFSEPGRADGDAVRSVAASAPARTRR